MKHSEAQDTSERQPTKQKPSVSLQSAWKQFSEKEGVAFMGPMAGAFSGGWTARDTEVASLTEKLSLVKGELDMLKVEVPAKLKEKVRERSRYANNRCFESVDGFTPAEWSILEKLVLQGENSERCT